MLALALNVVATSDGADFNYPSVKNTGDISFYQGPRARTPYRLPRHDSVRNVILLVGDGMGPAQVMLARASSVGLQGRLHMETLPVVARVSTHSANNVVTDSAAASTAMACGVKTKNGMVGMTPNGTLYTSILEAAQNEGMLTGLVATSAITHATPASFAGHVKSRSNEATIAEQLIERQVNVMFGGGRHFFIPKSERGSKRKDHKNLIVEAKRNGYKVIKDRSEIWGLKHDRVLGLFQLDAMTTKAFEPMLDQMTQAAIELLNRPAFTILTLPVYRGFFLIVEGSQIDWRCHSNDAQGCIRQTLLFDQAVKAAMDFAVRDQHTLVIVTADHETGGLTLLKGMLNTKRLVPKWATKNHSGIPVPLYAYGPGATDFMGTLDNTEIPRKIARLLGIEAFPQKRD
ncbi:MAG: alkaline phosphatase [Planctomycetes bacterium]|nr:alkaline phosphatase [Planctomycetota bacterium]